MIQQTNNQRKNNQYIGGLWENLPTTKPLVWAFFIIHMSLTVVGWYSQKDLPIELGLILRTCAPVVYAGYFGKSVAEHIKNRQFALEEKEMEMRYDRGRREEDIDCSNH